MVAALLISAVNVNGQRLQKWKITDVEQRIAAKTGEILVFNFWATFCKPCVAEIPSFIEVCDRYKNAGVKLILVSLDLPSFYPKKITAFAKQHGFATGMAWLQETNADYFCPKVDSSWSGSIPATLMVNTKTGKRFFVEGEIEGKEFEGHLQKLIGNE